MSARVLLLCLAGSLALAACDASEPADPPPTGVGSDVDVTARYAGTWASEDGGELYRLTVGLIVTDGDVIGTGTVSRRRAVGGTIEEVEIPVTGVSGAFRADSSAVLQARFDTGQTATLDGRYLDGFRFLTGTLQGASPFGRIEEEAFVLERLAE